MVPMAYRVSWGLISFDILDRFRDMSMFVIGIIVVSSFLWSTTSMELTTVRMSWYDVIGVILSLER